MSKIQIGLIGGGYWGKNLIRDFNKLGVLNTICDINEEALKNYSEQYPDVKLTKDWNEILENKEINAVCIALPAEMHYKYAKQALLKDKDVYVEKPITLDVKEAEELINIANEKNKILMVGHLLQYHPCINKIKEMIEKGMIGKVRNIVSNRLNLGKFRVCENVLWSFAPHDISVILSLCGNKLPNKVLCNGYSHITKDIHDITNSILHYDDKYVNINVNWLNPYKEQKLSIIGDKGMILFDDMSEDKLKYYPDYIKFKGELNSVPEPNKKEGISIDVDISVSPLELECKHFIDRCVDRQKPITDGEEGLRVLKVLNSLQKSLETDSKVEIKKTIKTEYFSHPSAVIDEGAEIGNGTKIWHFSHICKGAKIGKNCNVGQNVFIAGGAVLGNGCKVQNNVSIYNGVDAEDYVFFGPSCVLTNDKDPRAEFSKNGVYMKTLIKRGATLGANSTIICGNTIGENAFIGAGAVVTKDVKDGDTIVGNPGKKL